MESLVERNDNKRYEKEKKRHKRAVVLTISTCTIAAVCLFAYILNNVINKHYLGYEVVKTIPRQDSSSVTYAKYKDGLLKYSHDGASAIDGEGKTLWNGSYDMNNPSVDICGDFAVIGDIGGKEWYVYNGSDSGTKFEETLPIAQIKIAGQGVVAVLLNDKDSNEIHLYNPYDSSQMLLAKIPTNLSEDGYPIDIDLSNDGKKIVTSYMGVSKGEIQCKVSFYNFDDVGKDKVNRMVGGVDFGTDLIHKVDFVNDDTVCMFGEKGFFVYSMGELPEEVFKKTFKNQTIKSIVMNENYIGCILQSKDGSAEYPLTLYRYNGKKVLEQKINYQYDEVKLEDDEILFTSDMECNILRTNGSEKLHTVFDKKIDYVFHLSGKENYIFIDESKINKVKLSGKIKV
ncbi:DUF5711 family protein [Velocimicrobium porci]|uniref:Uncharacterized protein n=1 Tax=Velocimicrobium porci TaxID=2606634 RepID=A0A6L5Y1G4_9FIRM|nr:DUF5711 family protein [Velocimicrobium porci]MSS64561.1 hypothetical protein [Velocimicrobium porci]